ncbi:MAG TPA: glycoside hydrolase family 3 C-terminal domain-containing protein [Anaerolineaceae bacterium]|nr:glycoside hydrolase family 3 C-terminal domain-containing protein [Anaerolineaceae bacterium]
MTDPIERMIQEMSLDEKILLLAGADLWHTNPIPRLGIPALKVTDGPNGARGAQDSMGPSSVCTPVGAALGATWNTDLVEQVGQVLGDETRAKGAQVLLAPTVNIHRTPNAGRNFECYSEDPYLSGKMASAYIRGVQSRGISACIKHFVCNDQDHERFTISAEVQERPLHEIYLEPFRRAMLEAKPWSIMSAYNKINGVYASENDATLKTVLREKWGFDGLVMSDWFGTYSANNPAGELDLEMPGPARWMSAEHVRAALESGELTVERLDDKVRHLLRLMQRTGLLEHPERPAEQAVDRPEHRALMRRAGQEAIVLLKNSAVLPLETGKVKSIAVIGENARWAKILGGGSSSVTPHYVVSPLEGIRSHAGSAARVDYAIGCSIHRTLPAPDTKCLSTEQGERGLRIDIFDNLDFSGRPAFSIVNQRVQFLWFDNAVPNVDQNRFSLRMSGFFTPEESGLHLFGLACTGQARLTIGGHELEDGWTTAKNDGQKTLEVELQAGQLYPIQVEYIWNGAERTRSLSLGCLPPQPADLLAEAVELARHSDVAVIVAGMTSEWETEGFDRPDLDLPGQQNELIARVAAVNPNTIVVLNCGSPVTMPWIDQVAGVVQLWYAGQEAGNALADVLFGDVAPSGKLPMTFPQRFLQHAGYSF